MPGLPNVTLLTREQIPEATTVLGRAFKDYPLYQAILPEERSRHRATPPLVGLLVRYAMRYGEVHSTSDAQGAACWLPPEASYLTPGRMLRVGLITLPFRIGWKALQRLQQVGDHFEGIRRKVLPRPHWYLMLLGVDPIRQRTGVGSALVQPMLARADKVGLPCFLETQREGNVAFYRRLGFTVVHEGLVPGGSLRSWALQREPAEQ